MPEYVHTEQLLDEETRELIGRIPKLYRWEWRKTFEAGHSGAQVFLTWVTYESGTSLQVFKFDSTDRSEKEWKNWHDYAWHRLDSKYTVRPDYHYLGPKYGLTVYPCAVSNGNVSTFAEHYAGYYNAAETIEFVLGEVLRPFHFKTEAANDLVGQRLVSALEAARNRFEGWREFLRIDPDCRGLHVRELGSTLPNPLCPKNFPPNDATILAPWGTVHGDLNRGNILLVEGGDEVPLRERVRLIDFALTHDEKNSTVDAAKVETEIKFHLLQLARIGDWSDLLRFESQLASSFALNEAAERQAAGGCAELQKAARAVGCVRRFAHELCKRDSRVDPRSFWIQLFLHALRAIGHEDSTPAHRTYAFLDAALILDRQLRELFRLDSARINAEANEFALPPLFPGGGAARPVFTVAPTYESKSLLRPYKELDAFDTVDGPIFFGRESDIELLVRRILSNKLTVVKGKSGVGKTSVIRAGLLLNPILENDGYDTLFVRCFAPLLSHLRQEIERRLVADRPAMSLTRREALSNLLWRYEGATGRKLVIFLDQFEDAMRIVAGGSRLSLGSLAKQVGTCIDDVRLRSRFVIAIREESFSSLSQLEPRVAGVFANTVTLEDLSVDEGKLAIQEPALRFQVTFEPALINAMIRELKKAGRVQAPQLQIVCSRLFEHRKGQRLTLADYKELGRLPSILGQYLDDSLARLPTEVKRDYCVRILRALVSPKGESDLVGRSELGAATGLKMNLLKLHLETLANRHLIRAVEVGDDKKYELVHQILAERIYGWQGPGDISVGRIQDLKQALAGEVAFWRMSATKTYVSPKWQLFDANYLRIPVGDPDTAEFVVRSCVAHRSDARKWFRRWVRASDARDRIARSLAKLLAVAQTEKQFSVRERSLRAAIVDVLGEIESPVVTARLIPLIQDVHQSVRNSTIVALGRIGSPKVVRILADIAGDNGAERGSRRRAVWALGAMATKQESRLELLAVSETLMRVLADAQVPRSVRWRAAWALGEIKAPEAIPLLAKMQDERNTHIRRAVQRALCEMRPLHNGEN